MRIVGTVLAIVAVWIVVAGCSSPSQPQAPQQSSPPAGDSGIAAFRALYRELVETNTTASQGNCTEAAQKMADRLTRAGYSGKDVMVFVPEGHPKDGGLLATLGGTDPSAKPILLLAHIDVVEAKSEQWKRDPFKLIEQNGYFFARGAKDDKAMAAIFVDSLIRYRAGGFTPKRPIRLALTCGEEGNGESGQVNGAQWLNQHKHELVDARLAINEGGDAVLGPDGKPELLPVQVAQKISQDFVLTVTDEGGHSSQPGPFNAILALGAALQRLADSPFPVQLNDAAKGYFTALAKFHSGLDADAMKTIVANPNDAGAAATLSKTPLFNATLRTTCVPTMIDGGEATNALPQKATVNVNCRIMPESSARATQDAITKAVADPKVRVAPAKPFRTDIAKAAPLTPAVLDPIKQIAGRMWPGVPVIPTMLTAATDARYFSDIPVYGVNGIFLKPGESHQHGLDERIPVASLYQGRDFLYDLTKLYASQ